MPKIVPKDRALIFFSQLPIPSLEPHRSLVRVTGNKADAKRALTLDMLKYFNPQKKAYDYFYFYAPLKQGQKVNFVQMKDTYKLKFKKTLPSEKYEQPISMAYAILKLLKLKYKEVLVVRPMPVVMEHKSILDVYDLLNNFDVNLWRQKDGTIGVIGVRNSEEIQELLESILPCTTSKLLQELKSKVTLKEISPPLSSVEGIFNHSPLQIKQYYPELEYFGKLVS
jgi:hypothetical protein